MPEGDTIWRTARTLHEALAGRVIAGFASPLPEVAIAARRLGLVGQEISAVESNGKHLLIRFSDRDGPARAAPQPWTGDAADPLDPLAGAPLGLPSIGQGVFQVRGPRAGASAG